MEIKITVRNKIARALPSAAIVCDNSDYVVKFDFDDEWAAETVKTARVSFDDDYYDIVFEGDECVLPPITGAQSVKIGVYSGDLRTTTAAHLRCLPSCTSDEGSQADPPESVYNQLVEMINNIDVTISPDDIADAVEDYLTEHPVSVTTPDWSQNDETASNYVKNRTHWVEQQVVRLIEETSFTAQESDGGLYGAELELTEQALPIIGETATIVFGGVTYTAEVKELEGAACVGNFGLLNDAFENTGEPFLLAFLDAGAERYGIVFTLAAGEHTISAGKVIEVVHKLDVKYIPDEAMAKANWAENDETSPNYVQNRTHWSAEGGAELVPKQTAEVTLNSAVYRKMSSLEINESAAAPIIGSAAIVSFDGVDYVVTVNPYSTNSLRIGNERLGNYPNNTEQGDGEPFLIELFTNDDGVIAAAYLMVVYHDRYQETHTVTVRTAETVHQLSEKYIPAEILRIRDIPAWALAVEKPTYTAEDVGAAGKVKIYYSITNRTAYTPVAAMANDNAPYIVITTAVQSSVMSAYNTTLLFYPYDYSSGSYYGLALRDGKVYGYACHNAGIVYTLITNVVTVVDNLTTDDASKALSAAQGKALKALIDNIDTSGSGGSASSDGSVVTFTAVATGTTNGSSVVFDELTDGQTAYDAAKAAYSAGKEVLLNVTNSVGDWVTILRISKVNSNEDTIMFSNAEICETGEADITNEEMRLQWVVLKSDSSAAYYYVESASGGASDDKQWTKIIDTEVAEETSAFTVDELDNYSEIYVKWSGLKNKSDATASELVLKINDTEIAAAAVPTAATNGTALYGWTKAKYNGLAWEVQKSPGAISSSNTTFASPASPYNLVDGVGAAAKISLAVGNAALYAVTSGKIEVWGR